MYKYVYVCVYIYIFVYINLSRESIPAINHSVQIKKKKMSTAHLLITKPRAHSPIHELLYKKKKKLFFLRGKIKMLLSRLLILLHPYFYSLFNRPFISPHR